jgi:glycosyltransferase involved in cell wall biosynthesis
MLQSELVKLVQTSDALILYSRYETFGCVLIEANACGVPVIVSDVPVFHENVQEGFNGILAKNEDPAALAEKLSLFLDNQYSFRKNDIITFTKDKFSYKRIGTMYSEWYKSIINRTQKL